MYLLRNCIDIIYTVLRGRFKTFSMNIYSAIFFINYPLNYTPARYKCPRLVDEDMYIDLQLVLN